MLRGVLLLLSVVFVSGVTAGDVSVSNVPVSGLSASGLSASDPADVIYHGGAILTMNDQRPSVAAVAVADGKILAAGTEADIMQYRGRDTHVVELRERALLPGFVDAHGHVLMIGLQALAANMLPAPDGEVNDIATLQRVLMSWAQDNQALVEQAQLIIGFGYDNAQLQELRHPNREDLDAVSTEIPVYIVHQSGHIGVANSKALAVAGITSASENPAGGTVRREAGSSEPNGVLEENAHFEALMKVIPPLDERSGASLLMAGIDMITAYGYTTAQEGRAAVGQSQLMRALAQQRPLPIDIVAYLDVLMPGAKAMIESEHSRDYSKRFRVGGGKLTIDGSPQGFTAWRDRPYYNPPANYRADYLGYPSATNDQVMAAFDWAYANNIQLLTHANGEAASDLLLASAREALAKYGRADRRPVLIHGQFLREDQVDAVRELGIFPSLFPMHTFYWGDWHRDRTVGPVNADNISPTGWLVQRGMKFSSHHDAPVALPDSMRILDATVTRRSRSGDIIGPAQRVDVSTALKAMTIWPAFQHFEEQTKGSIEVGKLADLVILSVDPTVVDPETLDQIEVLQTIKEGKVIYDVSAQGQTGARHALLAGRGCASNERCFSMVSEQLGMLGAMHSH